MSRSGTTTERRRPTVAIQTLGCRLNQYESDGILNRFVASGRYTAVRPEDGPDIAIVNSCTVTDQADGRNRGAVRSFLKKNPAAKVIVTGCFAQTDPDALRDLPGVAMVVGNDRKPALFDLIEEMLADSGGSDDYEPQFYAESDRLRKHADGGSYGARPVLENPFGYGDVVPMGHTRAYMKIQDGCDRRCTYCKIPMARGRGISRPVRDILEHVRRLDDEGVPEIVLTGVNLGWYRDRAEDVRFIRLVEMILSELRYGRLRISSIEPCDVDAALGQLSLHPRFCDFLHVPLQSGSAKILKAMRRTYNPFSFLKRMETVLAINPRLFAGTDVIVGFPGETEQDFADTLQLCRDTQMANVHGFRYSARRGTPAAAFADHVPVHVVRERMNLLIAEKDAGFRRYAGRFLGAVREGIVEKTGDGFFEVLTDNYLRVKVKHGDGVPRKGALVPVRIQDFAPGGDENDANAAARFLLAGELAG